MAAVFVLIAAATASGSSNAVSGSTSASTGRAPQATTASAVAKNVLGGRITSSPRPMPAAASISVNAAVPEATPTTYGARRKAPSSSSNASTSRPFVNVDSLSTRPNARSRSTRRGSWIADRSVSGSLVMPSPSCRLPADDGEGSASEDDDIGQRRPLAHVLQVEVDHLVVTEAAPAAHLPQPCHPGLHLLAPTRVRVHQVRLLGGRRPGADEAHVAAQHVPELGEL